MNLIVSLQLIVLLCIEISINCVDVVEPHTSIGFLCKSDGIINMDQVCDGHSDCYDGSDEIKELCYRTICPDGQFRCHYGACISKSKKCNGIRDCSDGKNFYDLNISGWVSIVSKL